MKAVSYNVEFTSRNGNHTYKHATPEGAKLDAIQKGQTFRLLPLCGPAKVEIWKVTELGFGAVSEVLHETVYFPSNR